MSKLLLKPDHGSFSILHGVSGWLMRTRNHDDRNAKCPRCVDLGVGGKTPGVLGNNNIDFFAREKFRFGRYVEGTSAEQKADIGRQRDIVGRIDRARDVVVMRSRCEGAKLLPAHAQENTTGLRPQRVSGGFRTRDAQPVVVRSRLPGGAQNRGERNRKSCARGHGVGRYLIGIGMRRINDRVDFFPLQPSGKAVGTAEATDACLNRLNFGIRSAPGKRDGRLKARVGRKQTRQVRGLRCTSEDENAYQGHLQGHLHVC